MKCNLWKTRVLSRDFCLHDFHSEAFCGAEWDVHVHANNRNSLEYPRGTENLEANGKSTKFYGVFRLYVHAWNFISADTTNIVNQNYTVTIRKYYSNIDFFFNHMLTEFRILWRWFEEEYSLSMKITELDVLCVSTVSAVHCEKAVSHNNRVLYYELQDNVHVLPTVGYQMIAAILSII